MAPANQTKERSVHELFTGHSGTKVQCEFRACFPKEKHQNSQKWAKFMNFSFSPFLWFGLPGLFSLRTLSFPSPSHNPLLDFAEKNDDYLTSMLEISLACRCVGVRLPEASRKSLAFPESWEREKIIKIKTRKQNLQGIVLGFLGGDFVYVFFLPMRNDPKKTLKQNFGTHPVP